MLKPSMKISAVSSIERPSEKAISWTYRRSTRLLTGFWIAEIDKNVTDGDETEIQAVCAGGS